MFDREKFYKFTGISAVRFRQLPNNSNLVVEGGIVFGHRAVEVTVSRSWMGIGAPEISVHAEGGVLVIEAQRPTGVRVSHTGAATVAGSGVANTGYMASSADGPELHRTTAEFGTSQLQEVLGARVTIHVKVEPDFPIERA